MVLPKHIQNLAQVLETYRGHDKIISLVSYVAMFMGGEGITSAQKKWKTISTEMSGCQVILRFFDDLPMLLYNLSIEFGLKGSKNILKPLEFLSSILNQSYFISEHIAWLIQKEIIPGVALPFLSFGVAVWVVALVLGIIKSLSNLNLIANQAEKLKRQYQLDMDRSGNSLQNEQIDSNLNKLTKEKKYEILRLVQYSSDMINAISWMPRGILWGQSLPSSANGFFGIISTLIRIHRGWPQTPNDYKPFKSLGCCI